MYRRTNIKELKADMINQARDNWGDNITPCTKITTLDGCFTKVEFGLDTLLYFWFNDNENSTHTVCRKLFKKRRKIC